MKDALILNNEQIQHKIRRISYQILEANADESELVLAGIVGNGFLLAQRIKDILNSISTLQVILCEVKIDKRNPLDKITTSIDSEAYKNKALVLVDDVLDSGTTLMYGIKHFLEVPLKRFKTGVLVNRNHKKYPVKADFKGISLSTTIKDNITVEFDKNKAVAYLN